MKEFKNKVAAITGSATGIGRAFAEEAAKRGMRLALIDINTEGLEETKAICEKAGAAKVVTIKTDVTKYEEVRFSILRVMQEYGQLDLCSPTPASPPPAGSTTIRLRTGPGP